jgi:flagellar motor component MotA
MRIIKLTGGLASLGIFAAGIYIAGSDLLNFFDPASLLLVLFPAIFLSLTVFSPTEIVKSFAISHSHTAATAEEYKLAYGFFTSFQKYVAVSGFTAFFIGFIIMMSGLVHIKDPEVFGYGLAASLVSIIYAALIILIVTLPKISRIKRKIDELNK